MRKILISFQNIFLFMVVLLSSTGCSPFWTKKVFRVPLLTHIPLENPVPTDEYLVRKNDFGDGYIAHIPIEEANGASQEQIVEILVIQWLEHYKTQSKETRATIEDYKVDHVKLSERSQTDPEIVAGVSFSIIPAQIPNDWASLPGDEIKPDDIWWHLVATFGVYKDENHYWLKLLIGWGT